MSSTATHATARRAELFDQLVALFLAEGFAHVTLDDIASRLHCSKSTLYQLAPGKDDLVTATTVHFFRTATHRVEAATRGHRATSERLTAYLTAVGDELAPASDRFVADVAASQMVRIQTREVHRRTGLSDSAAYLELARLLTEGLAGGG